MEVFKVVCILLVSVTLSDCHDHRRMSALDKMLRNGRDHQPHTGKDTKVSLKELLSGGLTEDGEVSRSHHRPEELRGDALDRALHKVMDNMDEESKEFLEKVGEHIMEEESKEFRNNVGHTMMEEIAEKIGDQVVDENEEIPLSDDRDLAPLLNIVQSEFNEINDKSEFSRKKREVDRLLNKFGNNEVNTKKDKTSSKKADKKLQFRDRTFNKKSEKKRSASDQYEETDESDVDDSEITMEDLVNVLKNTRNLVPAEIEAAAQGAVAMGKHLGYRVRTEVAEPIAAAGYKEMATNYIPRAKKAASVLANMSPNEAVDILSSMMSQETIDQLSRTGNMAMDGASMVAKVGGNLASQGADMMAKYGGKMAVGGANFMRSTLYRLQDEATEVQAQLERAATNFANEDAPKLVPVLQDLVVDLQDTLQLAGDFFMSDVQPVIVKSAEPAYESMKESVRPTYETVAEQVGPTYETVAEYVKPAYADYVKPAYQRLRPVMEEAGKDATLAMLDAGLEARRMYDESVRPALGTMAEQARPAMRNLASNVADRAQRMGQTIQQDIAPPVAKGLKKTLDTMFKGMPSLVEQMSHEAYDAAKVFSKEYDTAVDDINQREAREVLEDRERVALKTPANKFNRKNAKATMDVKVPSKDTKKPKENFERKHITRLGFLSKTEDQKNRDL